MTYFKQTVIRVLPLLVLPLAMLVVASRVRSAAEFPPPCMEHKTNQSPILKEQALGPAAHDVKASAKEAQE
jgi:hypothetical protein